ncbi:MAG: hypothetical protein U0V49_07730 [Saprospiraceae bacterium]
MDTRGKTDSYFERQSFRQWWLWTILFGTAALFIYGLVHQLYFGLPWGDRPMSNAMLIGFTILVCGILLLFWLTTLETIISKDGIAVRFFPFILRYKNFSWNELSTVQLREYSAIREFGGWGLRWGFFGRGSAYIVRGDRGLQLIFKNGKKLLIGTQKEEALRRALDHFYPNK